MSVIYSPLGIVVSLPLKNKDQDNKKPACKNSHKRKESTHYEGGKT